MASTRIKQIKGNKYLYAEHSIRLPDGKIKKFSKMIKNKAEAESEQVKAYFVSKEKEAYAGFAMHSYKQDSIFTAELIKKTEYIRVDYNRLIKQLTKNQIKDLIDRFTVNFTFESNAIEGNSLTLKDVTMVLHENFVPQGKDLREVYETINTRAVNELLFKNKLKITEQSIIQIHKLLVKNTGVTEGYKQLPNFLLMRAVKTTPPEDTKKEMAGLVLWYDKNKGRMHPLKLTAEFHAKFERIHPFEDGNGRVGRVLINVILLENKYPPIIIRKTMRQQYFSALEAYDKGYKIKLERFMIEKFKATFYKFFGVYVKYLR